MVNLENLAQYLVAMKFDETSRLFSLEQLMLLAKKFKGTAKEKITGWFSFGSTMSFRSEVGLKEGKYWKMDKSCVRVQLENGSIVSVPFDRIQAPPKVLKRKRKPTKSTSTSKKEKEKTIQPVKKLELSKRIKSTSNPKKIKVESEVQNPAVLSPPPPPKTKTKTKVKVETPDLSEMYIGELTLRFPYTTTTKKVSLLSAGEQREMESRRKRLYDAQCKEFYLECSSGKFLAETRKVIILKEEVGTIESNDPKRHFVFVRCGSYARKWYPQEGERLFQLVNGIRTSLRVPKRLQICFAQENVKSVSPLTYLPISSSQYMLSLDTLGTTLTSKSLIDILLPVDTINAWEMEILSCGGS